MSSRQTAHYGLNQWEARDKVVREEFNGDNAKIDQALHTLAQGKAERPAMEELAAQLAKKYGDDRGLFYSGRYTGDGEETVRDYPAPFRPSFLFLFREDNSGGQYTYLCALGTEQIQFIAATSTTSGTSPPMSPHARRPRTVIRQHAAAPNDSATKAGAATSTVSPRAHAKNPNVTAG